jgi:hypothetical protein
MGFQLLADQEFAPKCRKTRMKMTESPTVGVAFNSAIRRQNGSHRWTAFADL